MTKNQPESRNQQPILPKVKEDRTNAYTQYSIRVKNRDKLQQLKTRNQKPETSIPTAVHYPMPLHLQEYFNYLGYKEGDFPIAEKVSQEILSLPMNSYLTKDEIEFIVKKVVEFVE